MINHSFKKRIMKIYLSFIAIGSMMLIACNESSPVQVDESVNVETIEKVIEKGGLKLSTNSQATDFDNAVLKLVAPSSELLDTGLHNFRFEVQNFELGSLTTDVLSGQCANSSKGQHIHFIMNNEPYSAHYEAEFEEKVGEGHNVLLSFLSRSYHMSIKNEKAFILKEFSNNNAEDNFDETAPHMFYSRPKGEYVGNDAKKVMLDFYLINTNLEDEEYTVTATINNVSFDIKTWEPYFIEGLIEGENSIKLELKDNEGNLVNSPYNPTERIIFVKYNEESI